MPAWLSLIPSIIGAIAGIVRELKKKPADPVEFDDDMRRMRKERREEYKKRFSEISGPT